MNPELKAPGTNLLTLKYDELLSTFAYNFNLRRYTEEYVPDAMDPDGDGEGGEEEGGDYADYIVSDGVGSVGEAETDMLLAQAGGTSGPDTILATSFLS